MRKKITIIISAMFLFMVIPNTSLAESYTFTSSGTFTVPTGVSSLTAVVVGGGGAGAGGTNEGAGAGGGGGGYSVGSFSVTPGSVYNVIVGPGGVHGSAPHCEPGAASPGGDGGYSLIGPVVAYGGGGGQTGGAPGYGGYGTASYGYYGSYPPSRWASSGGAGGAGGSGGAGGAGGIDGTAPTCLGYIDEYSCGYWTSGTPMVYPQPGSIWGGGGGGVWAPSWYGSGYATCDYGPIYGANGAPGVVIVSWAGNSGTINVSSNIASSWTITGPTTITGSGTSQSSNFQPAGTYTIIWGEISGYTTPASQSFTLVPGGTILFKGDYVNCDSSVGQVCYSSSSCQGDGYKGVTQCNGSCSAPAVPSNYGRVCLVSNVCGQSNQGTIGCDGSCTVKEAPALPSQYGTPCQSSVNSCGQKATGIIGCAGLCTANTPSDLNCTTCGNNVCNSSEDNSNCPSDCPYVAPATLSTPAGEGAIWTPVTEWTLKASPNPIFANTRTTVSWSVSGATGCTLVGVGAVSGKETDRFVGGPALDYQSSKLQENTDFTLTCSNAYSGRRDSKSVRVNVRTIKIREF